MAKIETTFFQSARSGDLTAVKKCLEAGIDVNLADSSNWRALHWAAYNNQLEVSQCLLEHGAKINLVDDSGRTALDIAREYKRSNVLSLLEISAINQNIPEWSLLGSSSLAHVECSLPLGRQITNIFNLHSRLYHTISENLKTHAESITPAASIDELPEEMREAIHEKFTTLGGAIDRDFVLYGTRQLNKTASGIRPCP